MRRQPVTTILAVVASLVAGCGLGPARPPAPPAERCGESGGPSAATVARAIEAVPGSDWVESARGYTRDCRLHWVKLTAAEPTPTGPEQLLFFDHDTALGSPTRYPKPYTTVVAAGSDTVTVQYQWPVGGESACCPSGIGTTRYRIRDGRLAALDPIPISLNYLGQAVLPPGTDVDGTAVGGLSGISYDAGRDRYYAISDDRSARAPARFYTLRLAVSPDGIDEVEVLGATTLLDADHRPFPPAAPRAVPPVVPPDPEGIAFDAARQRLYWSSEGERDGAVLADPFVRTAGLDGDYIGRFRLPAGLAMSTGATGPRRNVALEGLTLAPGGRRLYAAMEGPGHNDGPLPDRDHGALTRITAFDVDSAAPVAQYAYPLDAASDGARSNGLTDLVALPGESFLVIERGFGTRAVVRLFSAQTAGATDVSSIAALPGAAVTPMRKTLLADLSAMPRVRPLDNVEGITLGPRLPDGRQTVVLVSDDNFAPNQVTQFLLFALS